MLPYQTVSPGLEKLIEDQHAELLLLRERMKQASTIKTIISDIEDGLRERVSDWEPESCPIFNKSIKHIDEAESLAQEINDLGAEDQKEADRIISGIEYALEEAKNRLEDARNVNASLRESLLELVANRKEGANALEEVYDDLDRLINLPEITAPERARSYGIAEPSSLQTDDQAYQC